MTQDLNDNLIKDDIKPSILNFSMSSEKLFSMAGVTSTSVSPANSGIINHHHHHGLSAAFHNYHAAAAAAAVNKTSPFLLPAELYKSLFASAVLQKQQQDSSDKNNFITTSPTPTNIPRNLLFSCNDKLEPSQINSENNTEIKTSTDDNKINHENSKSFLWTNESSVTSSTLQQNNTNNNLNNNSSSPLTTSNSTPNTNQTNNNNSIEQNSSDPSITTINSTTINSPSSTGLICGSSTNTNNNNQTGAMPVHQGQNPTQGLVHWMSAVMAEHIQGNTHHDPTVGIHYMWNGGVDQCGQHSKEIEYSSWPPPPRNHMSMKQGYEAKMNDHHNNLQKGHILDDGRIDHTQGTPQMGIYGATSGLRPSSSSSNSPGNHHNNAAAAAAAALLVVPQPINATKMNSGGGTGRKYQCKMCPQIFSSKADLQLHTQIHMREAKPYKCSQCSKAFANSSYLSQHTRIHLGIKPYRCEICQRKFTQLSHLQQHIRTHTGDKPYKCRHPGCQKAFSQLSNLQSHSRCHQTDKPYKCNSCYKCFTDEPSLLEHIPKHKESKHLKTHICQYCGKSYTQETYLTKHMQKHSERTDKRPPITTGMATASGNNNNNTNNNNNNTNQNGNGNNSGNGTNVNRNIVLNQNLTSTVGDHPYWPKVSPDSQASLTDVMHQQQQQQQQQPHGQAQQQQQQQTHHDFPPLNGQQQQQPQHSQTNDLQSHHRMLDNGSGGREEVATTPTGTVIGTYDASSITKTTSNSAFTPINSMVSPHLNMHPMQRPYLYDAISFPNAKNVNQNTNPTANSFPNQLISLHQIRNYAHQPSGLMPGEHLLGVSVGAGK